MVLLMALAFGVFALDPPKMQCITPINNNQQVRINWSCEDCAYYKEYHFFVNGSLSYTLAVGPTVNTLCDRGQIEINITSTASYECYMIAVDNTGTQYVSDTIRSIDLVVTPSSNRTKAVLTWQPPTSSFDNSWGTTFDIYKKRGFETNSPTQPFASVPISTGSTYTDISDVCNNSLSYQIGITHSFMNGALPSSCPFMSAIVTVNNMMDDTRPRTPVIDSVSVTSNNKVMIGFHETEPYMDHFIIDTSSAITGPYFQKTTVTNGLTYWIDPDPTFNPSSNNKYYRVSAVDSCGNQSPMTDSLWNMKLPLPSTDVCLKSASFNWSKNDRPIKDIDHYEVNLSDDGGLTWRTVGTTTDNSYKIENLNYNQNYTVFVRAANSDRTLTASSNRIVFNIPKPNIADFSYIQSVSVIDNQYIQIKTLTCGDILPFQSITLQRSEDGINFEDFSTQNYISNEKNYVFEDRFADFEHRTYYYRTFLTNSCLTSSGFSNISHNILLRGNNDAMTEKNILSWEGYDNWDGGVSDYQLIRKMENDVFFNTITNISPSISNQYSDDISQLYESGAKFSYYIKAVENPNQYGDPETSYSNIVTLFQAPTLYIPNAFRPQGSNNKVFRPFNSFVSFDQYEFSIFTRTGECIFITTNPQEGWNGRINGDIAPMNVYVYIIKYLLPDGTVYERTGTVTLIK